MSESNYPLINGVWTEERAEEVAEVIRSAKVLEVETRAGSWCDTTIVAVDQGGERRHIRTIARIDISIGIGQPLNVYVALPSVTDDKPRTVVAFCGELVLRSLPAKPARKPIVGADGDVIGYVEAR